MGGGGTVPGDPIVEQRRIEVGGAQVAYAVSGAGPPVVLVHGLGGSGRWWRRNVPALARSFQVYVVDLVGFGRSRNGGPFALATAEATMLAWLDALRIERTAFIGHSLGGRIVAEVAAMAPGRVSRLVLVSPAIFPDRRRLATSAVDLARSWRHTGPDFLPVMAFDTLRANPIAYLRAAHELLTTDAESQLGRIVAPTLLVWGERDLVVPPVIGARLNRMLATAEFVVLPDTGHSLMWDRADAFNRLALEFLLREASDGEE